jgi:hypothetical protein
MTVHPDRFSVAIEGDDPHRDEDQQAHEDPIYAHRPGRDAIVTTVMDPSSATLVPKPAHDQPGTGHQRS